MGEFGNLLFQTQADWDSRVADSGAGCIATSRRLAVYRCEGFTISSQELW